MIGLLEPLGMAALASLLLPVVIHLLRRAHRRPLPFAALRFLNERRHPRDEWQIERWPLLALRLLLLAAVSLLLAIPVWRARHATSSESSAATPRPMLREVFATASRLRQLDAELPRNVELTVIVPEVVGGLDAERLHLSHAVHWEIVPGQSPPANAATERASSPLSIAVRVDAQGSADLPVAKALLSAWSASGAQASIDTAAQSVPVPADTNWLLWLGGPLSVEADAWVRRGGRALLARDPAWAGEAVLTDANGAVMFRERPLGFGRLVSTAGELSADALPGMKEASTAERLQSLMSAPLTVPDRAHAADVSPGLEDDRSATGMPLTEDAAVLAALLFLVERLWNFRRASRSKSRRTTQTP